MSDFARLASFEGRAGRSAFWWAVIGASLMLLAPVSADGLLGLAGLPKWSPTAVLDGPEMGWPIWQQLTSLVYLVALLPTVWLLAATLVCRCHDRNWSGAFLLVGLIPIVQLWPVVELGLLAGTPGDNGYGPSPKPAADAATSPMRFETSEAEAFGPVVYEAPGVVENSFPPPAGAPLPDYRFDDAPLTLGASPQAPLHPPIASAPSRTPLILAPLVKYARFDGRATRSEYWLFVLTQWVLLIGVGAGLYAVLPPGRDSAPFLVMGVAIVMLLLLPPSLAVTSRRLHDAGLSFAWWLVTFIPVIGGLINLVMMCLGGARGTNAYGPDPRRA